MGKAFKLTIAIPTYNRAELILKSVKKILSSKCDKIELLVSDNNSEDHTEQVLSKIKDSRFRYIRNSTNLGFTRNLVQSVREASSDFVLMMSDEDECNISMVEDIVNGKILKSDVGIIFSSIQREADKSYYYQYYDSCFKGYKAKYKTSFCHSYMSGLIINKGGIDYEFLYKWMDKKHPLLYPHEVMILLLLEKDFTVVFLKDTICLQSEPSKSFILDENKYYHYKQRVKTYQQYIDIIDDLNIGFVSKMIYYLKLAGIASFIYSSTITWANKKAERPIYRKELFKISLVFGVLTVGQVIIMKMKRSVKRLVIKSSFG